MSRQGKDPVLVQVMPYSSDIEKGRNNNNSNNNNNANSNRQLPTAVAVTHSSFARIRPLESFIEGPNIGDQASTTFNERELLLIEGYKISRVVRYYLVVYFTGKYSFNNLLIIELLHLFKLYLSYSSVSSFLHSSPYYHFLLLDIMGLENLYIVLYICSQHILWLKLLLV
jgi:hypothetical protein